MTKATRPDQIVFEATKLLNETCGIDELRDRHDIAYEGDEFIVFIDVRGYDHNEIAVDLAAPPTRSNVDVRRAMHRMAGHLCDRDWSTTWPVVVTKEAIDDE